MGGFVVVDPAKEDATPNEQERTVVTLDYFKDHPDIQIPKIMAADIEDRSKGDALSKIIAILQTTWFIVQCIARGQQQLALTELELVTLALASLNAVTFAIWWHKPLGVQEPIKIYLREEKIKEVKQVRRVNCQYYDAFIAITEYFVGRWPYNCQRCHQQGLGIRQDGRICTLWFF